MREVGKPASFRITVSCIRTRGRRDRRKYLLWVNANSLPSTTLCLLCPRSGYRYCDGRLEGTLSNSMAQNKTVPEMLSGVVKVVFLLCITALIPLGLAEWYSRHDAPSETQEMYDMLESILVGVIFFCIFVWVVAEAWREIRFHLKAKSDRERGEP